MEQASVCSYCNHPSNMLLPRYQSDKVMCMSCWTKHKRDMSQRLAKDANGHIKGIQVSSIWMEERDIVIRNEPVDIHVQTASKLFNVPPQKVTKEQRRAGKAFNFKATYGMSQGKSFAQLLEEEIAKGN